MSKFVVILFVLARAFVLLATCNGSSYVLAESHVVTAQGPAIRKLGKHNAGEGKLKVTPTLSPSQSPEKSQMAKEVSAMDQETEFIKEQKMERKSHHHSVDRSVAGGGVVLGGFGTTFLVAVFCYIRATRKKNEVTTTHDAATNANV